MAYFPNGSSGDHYQEQYCFNCVHYGADKRSKSTEISGCPIWDLHMMWNYERGTEHQRVLDDFIPMKADGIYPGECQFFIAKVEDAK